MRAMKTIAMLLLAAASVLRAQRIAPATSNADGSWPMLNGDYTSRRYSPLTQINQANVAALAQAWTFNPATAIKAIPIMVNGVLYFSATDRVWAIDAGTGQQIWAFNRPSRGNKIASHGLATYKDRIYFGTPDAFLVCLDAKTGKEIWETTMADVTFGYYMSTPPLIVKDRLIVGISGDAADITGFIKALDPETGKVLWTWNSVPKWGEPGSETWPNKEAMLHGGGTTWVQGSYDPELNLIYWGTGNPHPVMNGTGRVGADLYTCSIVALNPDTGKLAWYFQPSPHDTGDRDATESVVLVDGMFKGRPRKMLTQASRNGYFFVLDRATGENLLTSPYGPQNWSAGLNKRGEPIPDPKKEPSRDGVLFRGSGTNWYLPSFSPDTGLLYVNAAMGGWSISYLTTSDDQEGLENHQGGSTQAVGTTEMDLIAIDYKTGQVKWKLGYGNAAGILTTASRLLFTSNSGYFVALDPATGKTLWKYNPGGPETNAPMTYEWAGRQYVVLAAQNKLYAFALPPGTDTRGK
jgi:alcohol dehydrogenase (cytochrome c)